ncbi:MAG: hypothetical protein AAF569_03505 [Pseudomonadota bacterium]
MEGELDLQLEYAGQNPQSHNNIALEFGFDASVVAWSEDEEVRADIRRLLSHALDCPEIGGKALKDLDLSGEEPFNLSTAIIEDMDMEDLKLPKGTNLSNACFVGCNVLGVSFKDCVTE